MNGHHVHHPCRSFKCLCDLALSSSLNFSDLCHMREQHATDRSYSLQILEREDLWAKRSSAKLAIWLQRITSPHRATYNQKVFVVSHWDLWPHFWVNMCVCVHIYNISKRIHQTMEVKGQREGISIFVLFLVVNTCSWQNICLYNNVI